MKRGFFKLYQIGRGSTIVLIFASLRYTYKMNRKYATKSLLFTITLYVSRSLSLTHSSDCFVSAAFRFPKIEMKTIAWGSAKKAEQKINIKQHLFT